MHDLTPSPSEVARSRLALDLSPGVLLLLDHVASTFGQTPAQVVRGLVSEHLAHLVDQADVIRKRVRELEQSKASKPGRR